MWKLYQGVAECYKKKPKEGEEQRWKEGQAHHHLWLYMYSYVYCQQNRTNATT